MKVKSKIVQIETCPINTLELEGTTQTQNAVFALCDDGSLWMQRIGGGGNWTEIDPPQAGEVESDIYVIVADNDGVKDPEGPLIFEQYTRTADLASIKKRVEYLAGKYGKCRIARLVFIDDELTPKPKGPENTKFDGSEITP